jgi:hypothetical protein
MSDATTQTVNAAVVDTDTTPSVDTETVNTEVVDTDATTSVDTQPAPNQAEVATLEFDATAVLDKAFAVGKNSSQAMNLELHRLASQSGYSTSELTELLHTFTSMASNGHLLSASGFKDDEIKVLTRVGCHYFAGSIARSLDEQHNAMRVDLCAKDNGHGVYAEAGPIGHAGLGIGFVSKETKDGITTTKRTGAGVYLRADHVMGSSASSPASIDY